MKQDLIFVFHNEGSASKPLFPSPLLSKGRKIKNRKRKKNVKLLLIARLWEANHTRLKTDKKKKKNKKRRKQCWKWCFHLLFKKSMMMLSILANFKIWFLWPCPLTTINKTPTALSSEHTHVLVYWETFT